MPHYLDVPGTFDHVDVYLCNGCDNHCRMILPEGSKPKNNICNVEGKWENTILEWEKLKQIYVPPKPGEGKDCFG